MNLITQRLNKSFNGHEYFKYRVQVYFTKSILGPYYPGQPYISRLHAYLDFTKMRNWCWDQWGPSSEDHVYSWDDDLPPVNLHWAWRNNDLDQKCYLYFRSDDELAFFNLSWI